MITFCLGKSMLSLVQRLLLEEVFVSWIVLWRLKIIKIQDTNTFGDPRAVSRCGGKAYTIRAKKPNRNEKFLTFLRRFFLACIGFPPPQLAAPGSRRISKDETQTPFLVSRWKSDNAFSQTECCHFRLEMSVILPHNPINQLWQQTPQQRPLNAQPESAVIWFCTLMEFKFFVCTMCLHDCICVYSLHDFKITDTSCK